MNRKREGLAKLMGMRSFLVVNLGLALLIGWGFTGEYIRNREMRHEIESLRLQAEEMQDRNVELAQLAERYSGSAMLEREARLKLNLKKPGENVVVVRDTNPAALVAQEVRQVIELSNNNSDEEQTKESNFIKWIKHFFPTLFDK